MANNRTLFAVLIFLLAAVTASAQSPVRIILDTDFGDDGDDLAALAVLHHMADLGEAEIVAIGQSNSRWDAPGAIDVINTFYGWPDGSPTKSIKRGSTWLHSWSRYAAPTATSTRNRDVT